MVVASHGNDEELVLEAALRAEVFYVALVASRRRGPVVLASLEVDERLRSRVHTPPGSISARGQHQRSLYRFSPRSSPWCMNFRPIATTLSDLRRSSPKRARSGVRHDGGPRRRVASR